MKTREEAFQLLRQYTKTDSLLKHALAVEAAMRWYGREFSEDIELWAITGLLHDFDYEQYPNATPEGHPFVGAKILRELGYPEVCIEAILGHAHYSGVPRLTKLAKALFACDELCGLVVASVLVRPDKSIFALEVPSVKKKMKDKAFAKGVNRDDIILGAQDLQVDLDQHVANVILALREAADSLGLAGTERGVAGG